MPFDYGNLVNGGFGLIGSGLNYLFNKKLAAQQNQYNIDMWKMQADYNSPQAQMQRFQEAGLNPNLIYGQGSNGNMTSAPEQVVPQAPDAQKALESLAKSFNIENLKTTIAKRKEAQEEARIAELNRFDLEDKRDALARLQGLYSYDFKTGRFVFDSPDVVIHGKNPRGSRVGDDQIGAGYFLQYLGEKDSAMRYRDYQSQLLEPQIWMRNYDKKYYEKTFWIDRSHGNPLLLAPAAGHFARKLFDTYGRKAADWFSRGYNRFINY